MSAVGALYSENTLVAEGFSAVVASESLLLHLVISIVSSTCFFSPTFWRKLRSGEVFSSPSVNRSGYPSISGVHFVLSNKTN